MAVENTRQSQTPKVSAWHPLRVRIFRNLLAANLISDIGTFMQNVGAAWMMVSFDVGPAYVALTQTASALPFFVVAPLAASVGGHRDGIDATFPPVRSLHQGVPS